LNEIKSEYYHRQTSSSSSFFFRFPVVSFVGDDVIVGLDSFFGVTFSCLIVVDDFFVGVDDVDGVSFLTTTGVVELDFFAG